MKKIILALSLLTLSLFASAQSPLLYEDVQMDKFTNLLSGDTKICATLVTNIVSGEKFGYVKILVSGKEYSDGNIIPYQEIDNAIAALEYAKNSLIDSTPKNETRVEFVSSRGCTIAVELADGTVKAKEWRIFFQTDLVDARSVSTTRVGNIDKLIKALRDSKPVIESHTR